MEVARRIAQMGTLKTRGGILLSRNNHLSICCCSSPCPPCSGDCVDFTTLFPMVLTPPAAGHYPPGAVARGEYCEREGYGPIPVMEIYRATITNPLSGPANLVVLGGSLTVDDDLEVDGVSTGGPCCYPITLDCNRVIAGPVSAGGSVTLAVLDNWGVRAGAVGCACWRPALSSPMVGKAGEVEISKSRYAICRSCSEALQDGFSCRLVSGCCWGRRRSDPSTKCPRNLWPV